MSPIEDLKQCFDAQPNDIAFIAGDELWTYRRLYTMAAQLAEGLRAQGIGPADRVALHLPTSPEMVMAYYACFQLGAIAAPLNLRFKGPELEHLLRRLRPALYLGEETLYAAAEIAPDLLPPSICFITGPRRSYRDARPWSALLGSKNATASDGLADPDAPAVLLATSGTTGQPKFVTHTAATLAAMTSSLAWIELDRRQTVINALPMVHAGGLVMLLGAVHVGAPMILLPDFDADEVLDAIAKHHGSWMLGLPLMFEALLQSQRRRPRDTGSLRCCYSGSDVCPIDLQICFEAEFSVPLRSVWGATETIGALIRSLRPGPQHRVAPGTEIRLLDDDGYPVPRGALGELAVRGRNVTLGYWQAPGEITPVAPDGWFHTGDLMRQGEDGEVRFVSRKKDLIVRGGSNISPVEVEQALKTHPLVIDAAAVGIADKILGQRVIAAVQLAKGTGVEVLDGIRSAVRAQLADYKVPEWLVALDAIPRNAMGKIDRAALSAAAVRAHESHHPASGGTLSRNGLHSGPKVSG